MKKLIALLIVGLMAFAAAGCKEKTSKRKFRKPAVAKEIVLADFNKHVGSDAETKIKIIKNRKYKKNDVVKAFVLLKVKKGETKLLYKMKYKKVDKKWALYKILKTDKLRKKGIKVSRKDRKKDKSRWTEVQLKTEKK